MDIQYQSEKAKRKFNAAKDYLAKRDAFLQTKKPGYTVDMTGEDTSKMSDDQIKAEGNRRIDQMKTDFLNSASEARAAGLGSDPFKAAQSYLKAQDSARFSIGPGAERGEAVLNNQRADQATADRILSNRTAQSVVPTPNGPDWNKGQEAMAGMRDWKPSENGGIEFTDAAKARNEASKARYSSFVDRMDQERSVNRQADQDIALAKRENYNARLVERAQRTALQRYIATKGRRGSLITSDQMDAANTRLARSEMGLGPTNNVDDRYKFARSQITSGRRYNPWGDRSDSWATPSQSKPVNPSPDNLIATNDKKKKKNPPVGF